jgi:sarcosine oxidase subunit gamma
VADLSILEVTGTGLATVMARKGIDAAAIGTALGVTPPTGPHASGDDALMLIGTGPGTWLARCAAAPPGWAESLGHRLAGLASVSDQSAGYRLYRITGRQAPTLLRRGAYIDIDSSGPGSAATTVIARIGVIVRQVDADPTYELAVFRSYAESFRHWLEQTAEWDPKA